MVADRCVVVRNHAEGSAAPTAGVWITGSGCRVEDNTSLNNGYGFYVQGTDNFVVRNIARGNTSGNFSISVGNEGAPIMTNPGTTNFSGATPWSNFAY